MTNTTEIPKTGGSRVPGLVVLLIGLALIGFNFFIAYFEGAYFPKVAALGSIIGCWGLGLFLFPGAAVTFLHNRDFFKQKWAFSRGFEKTMWVLFIVGGFALAAWILLFSPIRIFTLW